MKAVEFAALYPFDNRREPCHGGHANTLRTAAIYGASMSLHVSSPTASSPSVGKQSTAASRARTSQARRRPPSNFGRGIRPSLTISSNVLGATETYAAAASREIRRGGSV